MTTYLALSGGLDSTVLAALCAADGGRVEAVSFDYGQRHSRELASARAVAHRLNLPHRILRLQRLRSPALTDGGELPEGHYADETMAATVVGGRNLLFAANLVALASEGDRVALAVHAGDHAVYPDCRPDFWRPLAAAVEAGYGVAVDTPFLLKDKAGIVTVGAGLAAPMDASWSCYAGGEVHCGRCGTCVERAEAFHLAGVPDPTRYESPDFWREAVGA